MIKPFEQNKQCCGCGACVYICPKDAIIMKEDQYGFTYPSVEEELCVDCGLCKNICAFGKCTGNNPNDSFAAVNKNSMKRKESSSAGIFVAIAEQVIANKGVVVGSEMLYEQGQAFIRHTLINSKKEIKKLQGSKYVQSSIDCYKNIEQELKKGNDVLFTGTPCQVAQIKKCFKRYEEHLFTIDLICHGVPNQRMFNDYLNQLKIKYNGEIMKFVFRDKDYGWGHSASVEIKNKRNKIKKYCLKPDTSSYYNLFFNGEICRDSCYNCPYANLERVGDITLGDYWGVETYSPEILKENGGNIEHSEGVSCIFSNNEKGTKLLNLVNDYVEKISVDVNKIVAINTQLRKPVECTKIHNDTLEKYTKHGYRSVERDFENKLRIRKIIHGIKSCIPTRIKETIKKMLNR